MKRGIDADLAVVIGCWVFCFAFGFDRDVGQHLTQTSNLAVAAGYLYRTRQPCR